MLRVVIVDDEALIRSGFELILSAAEDIEIIATCDGVQALDVIEERRPDVVLLDIRMPGNDGLGILADLQTVSWRPIMAVLTTFGADDYVAAALRLGANGFLLKDTDPERLPHLVRSLAGGALVLADEVGPRVVKGYLREGWHDEHALSVLGKLSDRESEVLRLIAGGKSNSEIAVMVHSSVGTVKDQVSAILNKLGVRTRVQAALVAQRAGILDR